MLEMNGVVKTWQLTQTLETIELNLVLTHPMSGTVSPELRDLIAERQLTIKAKGEHMLTHLIAHCELELREATTKEALHGR
jgi:hypothetical protein